jgi:hypothetical protein
MYYTVPIRYRTVPNVAVTVVFLAALAGLFLFSTLLIPIDSEKKFCIVKTVQSGASYKGALQHANR